MKGVILAGLFAIGVTLAGSGGASAAAIGGDGIAKAAKGNSLIEDVYYCRSRRVCYRDQWGYVHCHWRRYCW